MAKLGVLAWKKFLGPDFVKDFIRAWPHGLTRSIGFFCFAYGHWLFISQYLQTSLIFPKLLTEAKLERVESDSKPEHANSLQGWKVSWI